jgi:hypothetical protein
MPHVMGDFHIKGLTMRYSSFIPRLYNFCKSLGFRPGQIMPSRAFCSDESQGFPIILIAKHFGTFPFNHGIVGGVVATDRHAPHADHGEDLVIIQASHVGYDPEKDQFGSYRRLQRHDHESTAACGKICKILEWYSAEFEFAKNNIAFTLINDKPAVIIDNQLLDHERKQGLILDLKKFIDEAPPNRLLPLQVFSTSKAFYLSQSFLPRLANLSLKSGSKQVIGEILRDDLFHFRRENIVTKEGINHLESNLSKSMPQILTAPFPTLAAAQVNSQIEFDRTYRSIIREREFRGRNLLLISGINIDISPSEGQLFPLTKFVPWAAYYQLENGDRATLEQRDIFDRLNAQSPENVDKVDLESAIQIMEQTKGIELPVSD